MTFELNGKTWRVKTVGWKSRALIDRTGELRLATTDPKTYTIFLADTLSGSMQARVLIHELGHAIMVSYNLISELHAMVEPRHWIEAEEWVCNVLADYGMTIYDRASTLLGRNALACLPDSMSRLVS